MGVTRRIEVHVEHLELDGIDPRDGAAVAASLQAGLAAHLEGALPEGWSGGLSIGELDAGHVAFDGRPETLGARTADAVASRWGR